MRSRSLRIGFLLGLSGLVAALAAGCEGEIGGGGSSGAPSGSSGGTVEKTAEELFAEIEEPLVTACGTCHDTGGPANTPFLAAPDRYRSMVSWPGLVMKDWEQSLLLTYAVSTGQHSGTDLDAQSVPETLLPGVRAWLAKEAEGIVTPDGPPTFGPFVPILGFNALYLGTVDPALEGIAITFLAKELDPAQLEITALEVHPTKTLGVHITHPRFDIWSQGSATPLPDPNDTFMGLDHVFAPNAPAPLGPGAITLADWGPGAKLAIVFEVIEPYMGADGGTPCQAQTDFETVAVPQLEANCRSCHDGTNADANAAFDMSQLGTDNFAACVQVRNRVNPADPGTSQIFINTDPVGAAAHPFKFNGDAAAFTAFRDAVSPWIAAELPPMQ